MTKKKEDEEPTMTPQEKWDELIKEMLAQNEETSPDPVPSGTGSYALTLTQHKSSISEVPYAEPFYVPGHRLQTGVRGFFYAKTTPLSTESGVRE